MKYFFFFTCFPAIITLLVLIYILASSTLTNMFFTMATFAKIPLSLKEKGGVGIWRYVVFTSSILKASSVCLRLDKSAEKSNVPAHGYIIYKKEKIYYCRRGLVDDIEIYTKQ